VPRFCVDSRGEDVQILVEEAESGGEETHTDEHDHDELSEEPAGAGEHCHYHAGVE
jgi:zinc transporter 1/2/3